MKEISVLQSGKNFLPVAVPVVLAEACRKARPGETVPQGLNKSHLTSRTLPKKAPPPRRRMTFGDFVADAYCTWGNRRARDFVQLALKARVIEFRGRHRFVFC
jgi:hypothetical protein